MRQQQLLLAQPAQQPAMPGTVVRIAHQAGDHDLMHGVNHAGRRAGTRQRKAGLDHVGDGCVLAAEIGRHQDAEQALRLGGGECLVGEPGLAIDRAGIGDRHGGDRRGAGLEIRRGRDDVERRGCDGARGLAVRPLCAVRVAEVFSQRHVDDSSSCKSRVVSAAFFSTNRTTRSLRDRAHVSGFDG